MSTITKEWLQQKIADMEATRDEIPFGLDEDDSNTLAAMKLALASLEAVPVAFRSKLKPPSAIGSERWDYTDHRQPDNFELENCVIELIYTVPPAPVSVPDYPETLPCPVMLEPGLKFGKGVPTRTMLGALRRRAEYYAELEAMTPEQRAEHDTGMKEFAAMLQGAEPVTTTYKLPDDIGVGQLGYVPDDEQCKPHTVMAVKGELGFLDQFNRIIDERNDVIDIGQLGYSNYEALELAALDAFRAAMLNQEKSNG